MGSRVAVGRRNLFSERRRGLLGIAGTGAALLLVLAVGAVFDGAKRQMTSYIDAQPVQVFVAQPGVRNMHMASSSLPRSAVRTVESIEGVSSVAPLAFAQDGIGSATGRRLAYVIGYEPGRVGGPSGMRAGFEPGPGGIVLDGSTAVSLGVGIGDRVDALGTSWRLSGVADDLSNIANGMAFVRSADLAAARGLTGTVSYLLVTVDGDPANVATRIERTTGLSATTREAFARSERDLASDMIGGVLSIVTGAAWLVGLAVVALTLYAATRSRLREIGVMKALGASPRALVRMVMSQAAWTIGGALLAATTATIALSWMLRATSSTIAMVLEPAAVLRAAITSLVVGVTASAGPLRRISRVDPASVFRR